MLLVRAFSAVHLVCISESATPRRLENRADSLSSGHQLDLGIVQIFVQSVPLVQDASELSFCFVALQLGLFSTRLRLLNCPSWTIAVGISREGLEHTLCLLRSTLCDLGITSEVLVLGIRSG